LALKKEFVVIGLGRFGGSLVKELIDQGADVLAIDKFSERVDDYATIATQAVIADTTDDNVLKTLGLQNFEHVIVAIGEDIQSSILTTIMLKEIGVKRITVKAQNDYHEKVLKKIGADHVIHPERDMARRLATSIMSNTILDFIELSDEHSIAEIQANDILAGNTLGDLDVRAKYGLNIVAIKRDDQIIVSPQAQEEIQQDDLLILIGADADITRFEKKALH
jgi:trk system potassium uptake protein